MTICELCGKALEIGDFPFCHGDPMKHASTMANIITDDIPGGIYIRHGLVNADGSPRKFYSKTEIRRAANEHGLKWADDTPGKPYRVQWSGKTKEPEKVAPIMRGGHAS